MTYCVFSQTQYGVSTKLKTFSNLEEATNYFNRLLKDITPNEPNSKRQYEFYTIRVDF